MNNEKLKFGLVFGVLAVVIGASIWLTVKSGGVSTFTKDTNLTIGPNASLEINKQKSIAAGNRKDLLPESTFADLMEFKRDGDTEPPSS